MSLDDIVNKWVNIWAKASMEGEKDKTLKWVLDVVEKRKYSVFYRMKKWALGIDVTATGAVSGLYYWLFTSGVVSIPALWPIIPFLMIPVVMFGGGAIYTKKVINLAKKEAKELFERYQGYLKVFLYLFARDEEFRKMFLENRNDIKKALKKMLGDTRDIDYFVDKVYYILNIEKFVNVGGKGAKIVEYAKKITAGILAGILYIPKRIASFLRNTLKGSFGKISEYVPNVLRMEELLEAIGEFGDEESPGGLYLAAKVIGNAFDQYIPGFGFGIVYLMTGNPIWAFLSVLSLSIGFLSAFLTLFYTPAKLLYAAWPNKVTWKFKKAVILGYHWLDKNIILYMNRRLKKGKIKDPSTINSIEKLIRWMKENTDYGEIFEPFKPKPYKERFKSFSINHYLTTLQANKKSYESFLGREKRILKNLYRKMYIILSKLTSLPGSI